MISENDIMTDGTTVIAQGWATSSVHHETTTYSLAPRTGPEPTSPETGDFSVPLIPASSTQEEALALAAHSAQCIQIQGVLHGDSVHLQRLDEPGGEHRDFFEPPPSRSVDLEGDWPVGRLPTPSPHEAEERELLDSGALVSRNIVRVRGRSVAAIAALDPPAVEPLLRDSYGRHLYLFHADWTRDQWDQAHAELMKHVGDWRIIVLGDQLDSVGRTRIVVQLRNVTSDILRWYRQQPEGLVDVRPWFRVVPS